LAKVTAVVRRTARARRKTGAGADKASRTGVAGAKGPADPDRSVEKRKPPVGARQALDQKHYPDGTDGVSATAIHRKLAKDKDLQAELEKEGATWRVPSLAVINRVLARRQN